MKRRIPSERRYWKFEAARTAADLQAGGYLWFAVAAWNLCGVGGMPSFALYPQKMLSFDSQFFAVAQMKVVMVSKVWTSWPNTRMWVLFFRIGTCPLWMGSRL